MQLAEWAMANLRAHAYENNHVLQNTLCYNY